MTRTSTKREKLPVLLQAYLSGLEQQTEPADFQDLLGDDVHWTHDGRTGITGKTNVLNQINAWRRSVESARIEMQRMKDHEDSPVEANFVVHSDIRKGGTIYQVEQLVIAMYEIVDQKLALMAEHWQALPAEARPSL